MRVYLNAINSQTSFKAGRDPKNFRQCAQQLSYEQLMQIGKRMKNKNPYVDFELPSWLKVKPKRKHRWR